MNKQKEQMPVRYKQLGSGQGTDFYFERSLDLIFSPGCFTVEIDHANNDVGLPVEYCGCEHYIVGILMVTDNDAPTLPQDNRMTGQVLVFTPRENKETKIFTRTYAEGKWNQWNSLIRSGKYNNTSTTDELFSAIDELFAENIRTKQVEEEIKRSVIDINSVLGHDAGTIVLKASDLIPMTWNGTKMVSSTKYNTWVIPLSEGGQYSTENTPFMQSRRTCSEYPVLDKELAMTTATKQFIATSEMKYLVITVTMSAYDGSDYLVEASESGLSGEINDIKRTLTTEKERVDVINSELKTKQEDDRKALWDINSRLGHDAGTIVLKASDLIPMTWNGTKMVSSTNYNVWIVPLSEGREYKSVFLSFLNSRRTCSEYPVLGKELSMSAVSDSFKATSEMKYFVVTVDMRIYDGSDYEISASGHGLLEKFENLVPLVNETNNLASDTQKLMSLHIREAYACIGSKERTYVLTSDGYDNIIWNGTFFQEATGYYNGFVLPIYPGERIKCLVDGYANNMRTITEYPIVGSSNFVRTRSELGDEFIVQENEHYLFINNYIPEFTNYKVICGIGSINSQLDDFRQSQYPLYGKTIVCFGDSLTEGNGDDGKGYADYLAELTQANIIRGGVGGTQLATRKEVVETPTDYLEAYGAVDISNLVKAWTNKDWTAVDNAVAWLTENRNDNNSNQIEKLKANPIENTDIVIVFGGTNDCANGTFGSPNDTNPVMNTCGGINQIIDSILSVKPDMSIYFFTPIPRMVIDTWCDDYRIDQSDDYGSLSFPSLVKRIKECVEHNHIPCCDMYNTIGINRKNIYTYADDGVHPNHGYSMLANKMYSFIMANRI